MKPIGLIGLGLMGSALAERLIGGGYPVVGFDVAETARDRLRTIGGEPAESASDVFSRARTVLLSLPNSAVVHDVLREASDLAKDSFIIDTTTGDPTVTVKIARQLGDQGVRYLDATLTGSSQVAREGQLIVTAGGSQADLEEAIPVFRTFARHWFHVGPSGSGAKIKLVVNLVLGLNRAVLAEALAFARAGGLDLDTTLQVLKSGAAYSVVMDAKGQRMIHGDFTPDARLAQHLKDVRLILAEGKACDARLPLSTLHEELLTDLANRGFGDQDNSCIYRAFDSAEGKS